MARTFGESMTIFERHEDEVTWKKRIVVTLKFLHDLDKDSTAFNNYMLRLENLIAEGLDENYNFPNFSDSLFIEALKNYSFKQLTS